MSAKLKTFETVDIKPFRRLIMTIGELPTSFMDSMTYYEMLAWLCDYLQNTITEAINNNAEVSQELQDKFIELQMYVDDYFDNLDVQEEINNKLDEMSESGELEAIISAFLNANALWIFDTVEEMKNATNLISGSYARTLGFRSVNDGGGSIYKITDSGEANEMDVIAVGDLFATLVTFGELNVKQLGAYGDDEHDDSPFIQRGVELALLKELFIPKGNYAIYTPVNITDSITIKGEGVNTKLSKKDNSAYDVTINHNDGNFNFGDYPSIFNAVFPANNNLIYFKLKDICLFEQGQGKQTTAIVAPHLTYSSFENCRMQGFKYGMILGGWCDCVRKCEFFTCDVAIEVLASLKFINNSINECYLNGCYLRIRNAHNLTITGTQGDSVGTPFFFIDCNSVNMTGCSTEAWVTSVQAQNSFVSMNGCDFELHNKDRFAGFLVVTQGGEIIVNDSYIHYEDYSNPGEVPTTKHIVVNTGASKATVVNCKISTPFAYTNYVSGNGMSKINDEVVSNIYSVKNVVNKQITAGNKVAIATIPFAYGKNVQAKVTGFAGYDYASIEIDANVSALNRGSSSRIIQVNDQTVTASNNESFISSITAEYEDTDKLVIYYNQPNTWSFPIEIRVEYSTK